eukprot:5305092-Alexandrium_andersonii.AAC.1
MCIRDRGFEGATQGQKAEMREALGDQGAEWERKANDSACVPRVGGKYLGDFDARFVHEVAAAVAEFFVSRAPARTC